VVPAWSRGAHGLGAPFAVPWAAEKYSGRQESVEAGLL
jgi:hypothetical protein